jgi:hypothetical protein
MIVTNATSWPPVAADSCVGSGAWRSVRPTSCSFRQTSRTGTRIYTRSRALGGLLRTRWRGDRVGSENVSPAASFTLGGNQQPEGTSNRRNRTDHGAHRPSTSARWRSAPTSQLFCGVTIAADGVPANVCPCVWLPRHAFAMTAFSLALVGWTGGRSAAHHGFLGYETLLLAVSG